MDRVFDTVRSSLIIIFKAGCPSKLAVNNNYNEKSCKVNSNLKFNLKIRLCSKTTVVVNIEIHVQ